MLMLLFIKSKVCTSLPDDGVKIAAFGKLSAHDIHESDELRLTVQVHVKKTRETSENTDAWMNCGLRKHLTENTQLKSRNTVMEKATGHKPRLSVAFCRVGSFTGFASH